MTLHISSVFTYDEDAGNYIQAVETADGQALESATRQAINNFVIGCKQDGIWTAIKASCILAGARTLDGALVPLAGTAPTNNGPFVAGDYDRKTGLVGDGSTKYLDSNRSNDADPQDNQHVSVYLSSVYLPGVGLNVWDLGKVSGTPTGSSWIGRSGVAANLLHAGSRNDGNVSSMLFLSAGQAVSGFKGVTRSLSSQFSARVNSQNYTKNAPSAAPSNNNISLYVDDGNYYSANRLAFYSIGESIDLALLDGRVTDLITAFGAAIP